MEPCFGKGSCRRAFMSISRRAIGIIASLATAFAAAHCGSAGTCVRFSDCDPGMTCGAEGECVPAAPAVAASASDAGEGGVTLDASTTDVAHIDGASADANANADADAASDATAE